MKERILRFIKGSNQILLFLATILFIVMISKDFILDIFRKDYEQPKVQIVEEGSSDDKPHELVTYSKEYYLKLRDVYIFQISSEIINQSNTHNAKQGMAYVMPRIDHIKDNVVNLLFVKENGTTQMLLEKDSLITFFSKTQISADNKIFNLKNNIYLIASEDSNKNGYLDHDDKTDLHISSYDGTNLVKVMNNVSSYRVIEHNKLLIIQSNEGEKEFYTYNLGGKPPKKLNTNITPIKIN